MQVAAQPAGAPPRAAWSRCWASRSPGRRRTSGQRSRWAAARRPSTAKTVWPTSSHASEQRRRGRRRRRGSHVRPTPAADAVGRSWPSPSVLGAAVGPAEQQLAELVAQLVELRRAHHLRGARPGQVDVDLRHDAARPRAHHGHGVGEEHRLGDRVGDQQRGRGPLGPDPLQLEVEPLAGHLVERAERLVEQQDLAVRPPGPGRSPPAGACRRTAARAGPARSPRARPA